MTKQIKFENKPSIKSLTFKYDTWKKIQEIKYDNDFKSMDELINKMIKDFKK